MKGAMILFLVLSSSFSAAPRSPEKRKSLSFQTSEVLPFEGKLEKRVETFDTAGRTLVASLVELAYEYELPMGIEYLDREAATRPINLELRNESVRGILLALVQQLPQYQVTFNNGLVDVYAPTARGHSSNLLNKVIKDFAVSGLDTHRADIELLCALAREGESSSACGGSIALGQWGPLRITVHLQNATVYEILNAIVSQNGKAVWVVTTGPEKLSKIPVGGLWHIYPLQTPFKVELLNRLANMSP